MKKLIYIFGIFFVLMYACNDEWDNHYNRKAVDENIIDMTLGEYFESSSADQYSDFYDLLKSNELDSELFKNQFLTIWTIDNSNFDISGLSNIDPKEIAKYHMNYLAFGPTNLKDGLRIQSFTGVYMTISESGEDFLVNGIKILSSKRFKNGVVHEIQSVLEPRRNIFDYISGLPDEYSIIRDSILTYNVKVFDKANSIPIGVDATGNTLYDSVFYTDNPLFEFAEFNSEFKQFTSLIPSNEVIQNCFEALEQQKTLMGQSMTLNDSILAIDWIKKAIFFDGVIDNMDAQVDRVTPFGNVWRTTVQQIDESSKKQLSNGIAYEVTKVKIPNNVIITRIKSLVHYYEYLSAEEQEELYILRGVTDFSIAKLDETPIAPDEPAFYWAFQASGNPDSNEEFSVEFPPLDYNRETGVCKVMKVPPGEYNFYMGFRSSAHPYVNIYFHSGPDSIPAGAAPVGSELQVSLSTPWNYDRVNETDPLIRKWNGLGGPVGTVMIEGDELSTFRIKVEFDKLASIGAAKRMQIYHWTLKPTENNY